MKVNLLLIQESKKANRSLKKVRRLLYEGKEKGIIFYENSIFELQPESSFELYCYTSPNASTEPNAFPIHISDFKLFAKRQDFLEFLNEHYERYYGQNQLGTKYLLEYNLNSPYIGREYIWFFKKTNPKAKNNE